LEIKVDYFVKTKDFLILSFSGKRESSKSFCFRRIAGFESFTIPSKWNIKNASSHSDRRGLEVLKGLFLQRGPETSRHSPIIGLTLFKYEFVF